MPFYLVESSFHCLLSVPFQFRCARSTRMFQRLLLPLLLLLLLMVMVEE